MIDSYDLTKLDSYTFEHIVNALALSVLGAGATGFGPGSDGGRDGYFEGGAPYPSATEQWNGIWYIQSKFHKPHLSDDPQKWLIEKVKEELKEFTKPDSRRKWPDNWIIATNIDPSGVPETGAFDRTKALVGQARPSLAPRFHVWGGAKILALLTTYPKIAERYAHLLTPGNLLVKMMALLGDDRADVDAIIQQLVVRKFRDQRLTKLEQAGSQSDLKPAIHDLFVDLPFQCIEHRLKSDVMACFTSAGNEVHLRVAGKQEGQDWRVWARNPRRARIWFLRGGPGQGKSTIGQYYCQIQRAALILDDSAHNAGLLKADHNEHVTAEEVQKAAVDQGFWPIAPRVPLHVELKNYAQWYGQKKRRNKPRGILTFVAEELSIPIEQTVNVGTLKRALNRWHWVAVFDGLDEVPEDVKDDVAAEVKLFITQVALEESCDLLSLCTSRPQGYSGQFGDLDSATVDLLPLPTDRALACARPVISFQRAAEDSKRAIELLESSAKSAAIRELLTTPLQAHILAVVVRDGERPPDRRWKLYSRFYDVIRRREANRDLPDARLARLLGGEEKLLKTLHNRVGFRLQADAETSQGAETSLTREEFRTLASKTVSQMIEDNVEQKVEILDKATIERLVLINTPEHGGKLRFDIRQLQEFFAAECLYDSVKADELRTRIATVAGDAHWREVTHFLLSSLVENDRSTELSVAIDQLRRLNDGDNDDYGVLNRRAGKGALLAARLLSEGVLEQDKSVRQSFRDCLAPMVAFAHVSRLSDFLNVQQENSLAWLLNFLLDKLKESAPAENIGAAIVLAHLLPDAHQRVPEVQHFLGQASGSYLNATVDSLVARAHDLERFHVPRWLTSVLLERLTKPNWAELGSEVIAGISWLLRYNLDQIAMDSTVLDKRFAPLLPLLMTTWQERPTDEHIMIGNLRFQFPVPADKTHDAIAAVNGAALSEEAPGIFNLIQDILRFTKSPSPKVYSKILLSIHQAGNGPLNSLLHAVRFPIPKVLAGSTLADEAEKFAQIEDSEFARMISSGVLQFNPARGSAAWEFRFAQQGPIRKSDLVKCYEYSPELALEIADLAARHLGARTESSDTVSRFVGEILPRLQADPTPLLLVPWTLRLLLKNAATFADALGEVIIGVYRKGLPYTRPQRRSPMVARHGDFEIIGDLLGLFDGLRDASILPHIADLFLSHLRIYGVVRHAASEAVLPSTLMAELKSAQKALSTVVTDSSLCWSVRCSAALLQVLSSGTEASADALLPVKADFIANCNSHQGGWLLEGLVTVLAFVGRKQTPAASALVGDLFESCREDYGARLNLETILMVWREWSSAPVTSQGLRDRWLYRND
jgi:hypothetical protein